MSLRARLDEKTEEKSIFFKEKLEVKKTLAAALFHWRDTNVVVCMA